MLRMTVSKTAQAAIDYHREGLAKADYLMTDGGTLLASWKGGLVEVLGLNETIVDRNSFSNAVYACHPETGELLPDRYRPQRRAGFDLTTSVPKAVSVIRQIGGDDRILPMIKAANAKMMRAVEADMKCRVRQDGADYDRRTGNALYSTFHHTTSRPVWGKQVSGLDGLPDPHDHFHNFVQNLTFDPVERKYKACQVGDIKRDAPFYEAVFLNEVARGMRELGYRVERRGKWWSINGISPALIDKFSRRTAQVEELAKRLGITRDEVKSMLGANSRAEKGAELPAADLKAGWWEDCSVEHRTAIERTVSDAMSGDGDLQPSQGVEHFAEFGIEKCLQRQSVAPERTVFTEALNMAMGGAETEELLAAVKAVEAVRADVDGQTMMTTQKLLDEERDVLAFARSGQGVRAQRNPRWEIRDERLNKGQISAINHMLTCRDRVVLVRGGAGTGKSTLLSEAVNAMKDAGGAVQLVAPTTKARDVLREDGFDNAETLQLLLTKGGLPHAGRGATLIVDEAGLISVPDGKRLFDLASENDWSIILVGDPKQHKPVERGDFMRVLQSEGRLPIGEVTEIMRQRGEYKRAVRTIDAGNIKGGWAKLKAMGSVVETTADRKVSLLAADHLSTKERGKSVLVVAPTHAEKNAVSEAIRDQLKANDHIDATRARQVTVLTDLRLTEAEKREANLLKPGEWVELNQNVHGLHKGERLLVVAHDEIGNAMACDADGARHVVPVNQADRFSVLREETREFAPGDLVRVTKNSRSANGIKLSNGDIATLKGVNRKGQMVLDNGAVLAKDHGHIDHGYCATSHGSQGMTVDVVLAAMGADSERAMSAEQFYVTVSRGRNEVRIYTDDLEGAIEATDRGSDRMSAVELQRLQDQDEAFLETAAQMLDTRSQGVVVNPAELDQAERDALLQISTAAHEGRLREGPERGM